MIGSGFQESGGLVRSQRHDELLQGHGQAPARRLDVSLLSRPAMEEGLNPHLHGDLPEHRDLPRREEPLRDFLAERGLNVLPTNFEGIQIWFVSLPGWFLAAALYIVLSKLYQRRTGA